MKTILTVIFSLMLVVAASAMDQMTIGIFKVLDKPTSDSQKMVLKHKDTTETIQVDRNTQLYDRDFKDMTLVEGDEISIQIILTDEGRKKFAELTKATIGKRLAIVANNKVLSAPVVQEEITGGSIQISGNITKEQAEELIDLFRKAKNG